MNLATGASIAVETLVISTSTMLVAYAVKSSCMDSLIWKINSNVLAVINHGSAGGVIPVFEPNPTSTPAKHLSSTYMSLEYCQQYYRCAVSLQMTAGMKRGKQGRWTSLWDANVCSVAREQI